MSIYTKLLTAAVVLTTVFASTHSYAANPRVAMVTDYGTVEIELLEKLAPLSVDNFLSLVDTEFYDGLIFHRVIANFMIQGGGYNPALEFQPEAQRVPNESFNGLKNTRGSVAMARLSDPDSAGTQFFINVADNPHLDASGSQAGYTVFGRVIAGWEVVEEIEMVNTHLKRGMAAVPEEPVIIQSIRRIE